MKAEFIRHKVWDNYYYSLYVNGQKTNIYYPEIPDSWGLHTKERAEKERELIESGQVFPEDGNFTNFDFCGTHYVNLKNAEIVNFRGDYSNAIYHVTGCNDYKSEETQNKTIEEIKKDKKHFTQWTKRIDKNTGNLLQNIGVNFARFGYSVFFY